MQTLLASSSSHQRPLNERIVNCCRNYTANTASYAPVEGHLLKLLNELDVADAIRDARDGDAVADAFVHASGKNDVPVLQRFIKLGINVSIFDVTSSFALISAVSNSHEESVRLLLENHAQVDQQNSRGATSLMHASWTNSLAVVALLLDGGANCDIQCVDRETALMWSSVNNRIENVELLLHHCASVDIQNKNGMTALMFASSQSHKDIVELLLNHGADTDLKNFNGKTALDLAKKEEIKELLRNHVNTNYVLK